MDMKAVLRRALGTLTIANEDSDCMSFTTPLDRLIKLNKNCTLQIEKKKKGPKTLGH